MAATTRIQQRCILGFLCLGLHMTRLSAMMPPMTSRASSMQTGFKGNKAHLPSKPCLACGRPMSWRQRWARNWDAVKFCSDACRRRGVAPSTKSSATSSATPTGTPRG